MKRSRPWLALTIALCPLPLTVSHAQQPKKGGVKAFMRPKLKYSQKVLEGLATENYAEIAKNAKALNLLSQAADWQVLPGVEYVEYSSEFQRLTNDLVKQANEKDIEGATLAYVQLTMNCVNCHKYLRKHNGAGSD